MNILGIVVAAATFIGIWWGHVGVRVIERRTEKLWKPIAGAIFLGVCLEVVSLMTGSRTFSAVIGILGVTVLWDALEFVRQERRVMHGHAPANPDNPRHANILAEHPKATTLDFLNRDPIGRAVSAEEAALLVSHSASQYTVTVQPDRRDLDR